MNLREDDVSAAVQHAFSDVHLNTPVEQVLGRGRRLRTRRRTAAGGLTVATAAIALAVPLLQPAADGPGPMVRARVAPAASAGKAGVQLDLAAYSVHTGADGTVTVTVRQVFDPAAFTKVLNDAGVPAVVTIHRFHTSMACTGGGDPEAGDLLRKIISAAPGSPGHMMTIRPSLIPHGGTLTFDYAFYPGSTYPAVGTGFANVHGFSPCRWVPAPSRASHP